MQVQTVLYTIISATSYYRFRGTTPFEIAHGSYGQQRVILIHASTEYVTMQPHRKYPRMWICLPLLSVWQQVRSQ